MELVFDSHRNTFHYTDSEGLERKSSVTEFLNTLADREDQLDMEIRKIDGKIHLYITEVGERKQKSSYSPPKRLTKSEEKPEKVHYSPGNSNNGVRQVTFY